MNKRGIIIVMPAFNEAATIDKVIKAVPKTLKVGNTQYALRVVVVDDCSQDNTYEVAKKAGATVLRHIINCGAGAATRTGLRYAELHSKEIDYVVTIDSDGQHSSSDIAKIVRYAAKHKADMVVGNRLHDGNKQSMPWYRTLGNWGISMFSRILFGIKTKDTQSGLRLIHTRVLPDVADFTIDRYGFATDMLWQAVRNGITVYEAPISVHYSKETLSHGQSNWGAAGLLFDLLWIRITR